MSPPFDKGGQGGIGDEVRVTYNLLLPFVTFNRHFFSLGGMRDEELRRKEEGGRRKDEGPNPGDD